MTLKSCQQKGGVVVNNLYIRQEAKRAGVALWEIADALGIADSTLYRQLRREPPAEKQKRAIEAIRAIAAQKGARHE